LKREDAEEYSQSLAQIGEGWWRQIAWAFRQEIPETLGMSRQEWLDRYYQHLPQLPIEERREIVAELTEEGMSTRQIAEVVGVSQMTVVRDQDESNDSPTEEESPSQEAWSDQDESNDSPEEDVKEEESGPEEGRHLSVTEFVRVRASLQVTNDKLYDLPSRLVDLDEDEKIVAIEMLETVKERAEFCLVAIRGEVSAEGIEDEVRRWTEGE
jgi:transposase-like protein